MAKSNVQSTPLKLPTFIPMAWICFQSGAEVSLRGQNVNQLFIRIPIKNAQLINYALVKSNDTVTNLEILGKG